MTFKAMKFRVRDEEHSRQIQERLFEMGYKWSGEQGFFSLSEIEHLYAGTDGSLGWTGDEDEAFFLAQPEQEVTLEGILPAVAGDNANPKAALGAASLPMSMMSPLAHAHGSLGKANGAGKYGGANYIGTNVVMSIYLDAIQRHLDSIKLGEKVDPVDGVNHFGAIIANCDILLCAEAAGTLIDDRLRCDGQLEALRALKPLVSSLQQLHKDKNPKHYYMKNKEADSGSK